MQNESFLDGVQSPTIQPSIGFTAPTPQGSGAFDVPPVPEPRVLPTIDSPARHYDRKRWLWVALGIGILLALVGGVLVVLNTRSSSQLQVQSGEYNTVQIPLGDLTVSNTLGEQTTKNLKINGQLFVSGSLVLTPSTQPQNAVAGQLYYDKTSNQLSYYNGTEFVGVGAGQSSGGAASTTNITNLFSASGSDVQLQANAPGIQQFGNFNVSGTGQVGTLQTSTIASPSVLSATSVGDMSIATTAGTGVTSGISIKTGDSSTTASGNITIDTGNGIIDGEVVEHKTFEGGVDDMQDWFNTTIATTTEQAHSGIQSLKMTPSSNFWGIIEQLPGTTVTPGHQYHFSIWVRAQTTGRTIGGQVVWQGTGGVTTPFTSVVDNTTGWTEITLTGPAPAGATSVYFQIQSNTGIAGEAHYFDDITITDLSSGTAVSSLDIGSTNAKIVTIGNLNQIGATTIRGGSGIDIQSGAAGTTIAGGTVNITGSAASTYSTAAGALTLTSAAATTWSVGTSSSGAGGNLTLHAGGGAFGNNDGGDLVLQGGSSTGTGIGGSVIVRSQVNATDAFQIQNSVSTALFTADTTNMIITVAGTDATYAKLTLANAHFGSTQTTPPAIGTPTDCGTGPAAAMGTGATDTAGSFTITTGLGGTSAACDTVVTFNRAYGAAPKSIIVVGNSDANSVARQVYVSNSTATTFTVRFAVSAGGANNTMYSFNYWVIE